jgi:tetratricopeptide (TPR) repeat protein
VPPMSLTRLLFVFAFACASLVPHSGALGDDWYDCESDNLDLKLQGCTRIILRNSNQDSLKSIGRAYFKRGSAYSEKKFNDLAIADYEKAIRLNPSDTEAIKARADALRKRDAGTAAASAQPTTVVPSCPADHDFFGGQCLAIAARAPIRTAPKRTKPVPSKNGFANLDCKDLWYARNGLYADQGYCFKTARGKAAFHNAAYPNVCKPPHGKLPADWEATVAEIKQAERHRGCK